MPGVRPDAVLIIMKIADTSDPLRYAHRIWQSKQRVEACERGCRAALAAGLRVVPQSCRDGMFEGDELEGLDGTWWRIGRGWRLRACG